MKVINLFSGPGAGKSTTAYGLANLFKKAQLNVEYVHEEAKEFTWEERKVTLDCQPYIFGKQMRNLWRLKDKVDYAVTDSPILLSYIYADPKEWPPSFFQYIIEQFNAFDNLNFFLRRQKPYNPVGRNQNFDEAKELDEKIIKTLINLEIPCVFVDADLHVEQKIFDILV